MSLGSYIHSDVALSQSPDALDYPTLGPQNAHRLFSFSHVSTYFIKIGWVPFFSPHRNYCSLLKLPMQCAIIPPACIHEWFLFSIGTFRWRSIISQLGKEKKKKKIHWLHCIQLCLRGLIIKTAAGIHKPSLPAVLDMQD